MTPKIVSVVIPTFNRADLIVETLASVLGQSYSWMEVIVVDDGSTDGTEAVVAGIGDGRVRYIRNEWSGLPAVNRNTGIREACGRYVAFVDSDDLWRPDKLALQVELLEERRALQWCFTHYDFLEHETGVVTSRAIPRGLAEGPLPARRLLGGNCIGSMTPLVRREFLDRTGLFSEDPTFRFVEDWEFWLRLLAHSPGWFLPVPMASYRLHFANATRAPEPEVTLGRCLAVLDRAVKMFPAVYGRYYYEAAESCSLDLLRQMIVDGDLEAAGEWCAQAGKGSFRAPRLMAMRAMAALPRPVVNFLLNVNRCRRSLVG